MVYDAEVLIAADPGERHIWAEHRVRLEAGYAPLVPAPVLALANRSPRQARLRQLLRGGDVVTFDEDAAHRVGPGRPASRRQVGPTPPGSLTVGPLRGMMKV